MTKAKVLLTVVVGSLTVFLSFISFNFNTYAESGEPIGAVFKLPPSTHPSLYNLFSDQGLKKITFGLTDQQMEKIYLLTKGKVDFRNYYKIKIQPSSPIQLLSSLKEFKGFLYKDVPPPGEIDEESLGDPEFKDQWWVKALRTKEAWEMATGKGITVVDCDAGFYIEESDLAPNLLLEHAIDLADKENPSNISDGNFLFHGTAVVAIIAGVLDSKGTNGIAYDSKLIPLQNYNYDSSIDDIDKEEATAACILHALTIPNVDIIVLENQTMEGSSETFEGTRNAVTLALEAGITIVSAGGNYSRELLTEKENDTGSIIVGALRPNGAKASFSNYGNRITTAAYGERVYTLFGPNGQFGNFSGTSSATPQVTGAVALMLEVNPTLTPQQIRDILILTRVTTPTNSAVGGKLDIAASVKAAKELEPDVETRNDMDQLHQHLLAILR